jgi:hypothetical protein
MLSLSGTGIITITPPATNTNRAITLPDAAGALVVSGTTPSLNGITFPATQVTSADANTLDDYEEGTWTPTQGGGLTVVGTFSSAGTYTKIGRQVTINGKVSGSTSVSVGIDVLTQGLPFSVVGTDPVGTMTNNAANVSATCISNGVTIYACSAIAPTSNIFFSLTYFTS